MRLISARFKGLKGIYNKSGQKEIFIDFTKCLHNIIYIVGKNGSGKSTLMNALNPLPDTPQMYIDHELGEKEIVYQTDSEIYNILIQYPVYANGNRAVSKAFFREVHPDGTMVELNSNGTVGSFKDIVFSKFSLDPNFVSLSFLSVENRGIVDKKPADRKKLISNLLESVEVYNDIYKTLVKRSSVFRSIVNSIAAKIDSIGDEQKLIMDRTAAINRINVLEQNKKLLEDQIASSRATINLLDPNNENQNTYKSLMSELSQIENNLKLLGESDIKMDDLVEEYTKLKQEELIVSKDIQTLKDSMDRMLTEREEEAKIIFVKREKYNSLTSQGDFEELEASIRTMTEKVFGYQKIFQEVGIDGDKVTKDEYILGLNTLESFRTAVANIKSYASNEAIIQACEFILSGKSVLTLIDSYSDNIEKYKEQIADLQKDLAYAKGLYDKTKILDNRPEECKVNTCSFIKDALEAKAQNPEKKMAMYMNEIDSLKDLLKRSEMDLEKYQEIHKVYSDLNIIVRSIRSNAVILAKMPNGNIFSEVTAFLNRVMKGDNFNDIYDLYQYIGYANVYELYKVDMEKLNNLKSDMKLIKAQREIIDNLQEELSQLGEKLANITDKMSEANNEITKKTSYLGNLRDKIDRVNNAISKQRRIDELRSTRDEYRSKLNTVSVNIEKISAEINKINAANSQLQGIVNELGPLSEAKDNISYSLTKLAEYKAECAEYEKKYQLIELLKKYSSPTKGGIQTIFMQLYMDKTLSLSNQLLSMMFEGEMEILPYVINENEFRIPVVNHISNMITDDISNCSTSERSMVGMIMGFAMMYQSSTVYNIIKLDEIDGGLDQYNRSMFPSILSQIMQILNVENCLIVSHAAEADMSNVDIISLTPVSNEVLKGNVIFQL